MCENDYDQTIFSNPYQSPETFCTGYLWNKSLMSQFMRFWYLSHRRPAKAHASLRIRAVSPEPSLFAYIKYGSRRRARPTSSPKGNDRSPESNVPRSICPKTLCSLSPTPMMLHIKFDQDWPTGFRDIQVQKCEFFVTQGQVTPK